MTRAVSIAILLTVSLAETGLAEGVPQLKRDTLWPAPVGHRQPRAQDLPPRVQQDERANATPSERSFDKSLQICRGC